MTIRYMFKKLFSVLVFSLFVSAVLVSSANAALYQAVGVGSRGQQVSELQQILTNLGLYKGGVGTNNFSI